MKYVFLTKITLLLDKIEKALSTAVWKESDIDEFDIPPEYVGKPVVPNDFIKIECTAHLLKNVFKGPISFCLPRYLILFLLLE